MINDLLGKVNSKKEAFQYQISTLSVSEFSLLWRFIKITTKTKLLFAANSDMVTRNARRTNMKFSIKDFFRKCDQIHSFLEDLVTFIEEILNGKLYFLYSGKMELRFYFVW